MISALLTFSKNNDGITEMKKFSEMEFNGDKKVSEMLYFLEHLVTFDKYSKQLTKIEGYKQLNAANLKQIDKIKSKIGNLMIKAKFFPFGKEDYKNLKLLKSELKVLKNKDKNINKKIKFLQQNMFYTFREKYAIQRELLIKLGFVHDLTHSSTTNIGMEKYISTISDEELYEKARDMFNNLENKLQHEIAIIKDTLKSDDVCLIK